jgi:hypothetical protein
MLGRARKRWEGRQSEFGESEAINEIDRPEESIDP